MSSPFGKATRRLRVDRPQVEAPRGVQPSGTNRPSSSSSIPRSGPYRRGLATVALCGPEGAAEPPRGNAPSWSAAMAGEAHPVPSRTRKLSPRAPMVLRSQSVGEQDAADQLGAFSVSRSHREIGGAAFLFFELALRLFWRCGVAFCPHCPISLIRRPLSRL